MIRESIANSLIAAGRTVGRMSGLEMAVDVSKHNFKAHMMDPDSDARDWDPELFKSGNLFYQGYANAWRPIKAEISRVSSAELPDKIELEGEELNTDELTDAQLEAAGLQANADVEEPDTQRWVGVKASRGYITTIEQDNYSQLMNPKEHMTMIMYGLIGLGIIAFFQIIITLWATGSFA